MDGSWMGSGWAPDVLLDLRLPQRGPPSLASQDEKARAEAARVLALERDARRRSDGRAVAAEQQAAAYREEATRCYEESEVAYEVASTDHGEFAAARWASGGGGGGGRGGRGGHRRHPRRAGSPGGLASHARRLAASASSHASIHVPSPSAEAAAEAETAAPHVASDFDVTMRFGFEDAEGATAHGAPSCHGGGGRHEATPPSVQPRPPPSRSPCARSSARRIHALLAPAAAGVPTAEATASLTASASASSMPRPSIAAAEETPMTLAREREAAALGCLGAGAGANPAGRLGGASREPTNAEYLSWRREVNGLVPLPSHRGTWGDSNGRLAPSASASAIPTRREPPPVYAAEPPRSAGAGRAAHRASPPPAPSPTMGLAVPEQLADDVTGGGGGRSAAATPPGRSTMNANRQRARSAERVADRRAPPPRRTTMGSDSPRLAEDVFDREMSDFAIEMDALIKNLTTSARDSRGTRAVGSGP